MTLASAERSARQGGRAWFPRAVGTAPSVLALVTYFCAFVLGAGFAKWVAIIPNTGISLWPPNGLAMAVLLLTPRQRWPWWLAIGLLAELTANAIWFHNPVGVAVLMNVGNMLHALAGAALITRMLPAPVRFETPMDVLLILLLGAVFAAALSASVGAATVSWFKGESFERAWALWWIGDATGVAIVTPLVLVAAQSWREKATFTAARMLEAGALALVLVGLTVLAMTNYLPFAYIVMPALLWAAMRFRFQGAVITIILLVVLMAAFTVLGRGPFAGDFASQTQKHVMLQLFLVISALSALLVAAVSQQNRSRLDSLKESYRLLEQRVQARTAQLAQSEQRFRLLADAVPVIIWVTDQTGAIDFVNREYERFFGVTVDQARRLGWQSLLHPEDREAYIQAFASALREHREFQAVARVRRADGEWRIISSHGSPRLSDAGGPSGMVGSSPDITEQVRSEKAMADTSRRKDEFLAMLAHELRNPLAPIRNVGELLLRTETDAEQFTKGASGPQRRRLAGLLLRQVNHMARLVDDLLDVSRVSQGKIHLEAVPVDVADVVQRAVEQTRPLLEQKHHRFHQDACPAGQAWVKGDVVRLAQVVANLLNNAVKYTPAGGDIFLHARAESARVVIEVRDNGPGIAQDLLPHVFELFVQGEKHPARTQGGLGIGLNLVHRLVQLHGGSVSAASEGENKGCTFTISLPRIAPDATRSAKAHVSTVEPCRILVVDDNRDAAMSLRSLLSLEQHQVKVVFDAQSAIDVARESEFDLMILDIGLPDMDGFALARALRAVQASATLVSLSGYSPQETVAHQDDSAFDHRLVKPADPEQIRQILRARTKPSSPRPD